MSRQISVDFASLFETNFECSLAVVTQAKFLYHLFVLGLLQKSSLYKVGKGHCMFWFSSFPLFLSSKVLEPCGCEAENALVSGPAPSAELD